MNDFSELLPTTRRWMRSLPAASLDFAKRGVALGLAGLMVPLGAGNLLAYGQDAPPPPPDQEDQGPPPQQWNALAPDQLDQLVAPIALYPDSLVAQVLAAATYPSQVVDADRFVQANRGVPPDELGQMVNQEPWDPSVKALAAFPSVLSNMDRNLDWTTQLGNAYYNQPQDVMSAVQVDRQQAYQAGKLRSTPQLNVVYQPADIVIEPANPAVVYVPYYDPVVIWGWHPWYRWYAPPPPPGFFMGVGVGFGFGVGVAVGVWRPWGWGWGHWGMGWGPHPVVVCNRVTYISRSVTVVNHGYYGHFDGHFDRDRDAREWNRREAAHVRAAGYYHGYEAGERAGARAGYNNGVRNGYDRGYNRGEQNGYNHGYNRGENNGFNRGQDSRNFNRPQSDMRPAQNYNRGQQNNNRPAPNFGPMNNNRGQQNYSRPQSDMRPAQNYNRGDQNFSRPQARPEQPRGGGGGGHPENRGGGGGGGHDNHGGGGGDHGRPH